MNEVFCENELKIKLSPAEYDLIRSYADKQPTSQVNHYFDTTDDLSRMVRVRVKNGKYALQYKNRNSVKGNVFNCAEQGIEVDKEFLQNAIDGCLDKDFVNKYFGSDFAKNLRYLGCAKTQRIKFNFFGFEIELDKNIVDGKIDFELEYESTDDKIAQLTQLLEQMKIKIKQSTSKLERFLKTKEIL